jgi:hypothetical protein
MWPGGRGDKKRMRYLSARKEGRERSVRNSTRAASVSGLPIQTGPARGTGWIPRRGVSAARATMSRGEEERTEDEQHNQGSDVQNQDGRRR